MRSRSRKPLPPPPAARADWAYFVDLDGTLVNIADTPDEIAVDAHLRRLVAGLQAACGGALALVSGRSLTDLDRHLAPLRPPAAGQHGLERRTADGTVAERALAPGLAATLRARLAALAERHPGVLVEDKGLSVALHYRSQPRLAPYLHRTLRQLAAATPGGLVVQRGKRVVEARPAGADKGQAVAAFLAEAPFRGRVPVFIGDDVTDEHGFAIVNSVHGISIKVGAGRTAARHRLRDVAAVIAWLSPLLVEET